MSLLIENALVVLPGSDEAVRGYVYVEGEIIDKVGSGEAPAQLRGQAAELVDARGSYLMPGAIDCHVHFREPGLTVKATMASESRAAIAGGVTSWVDMPNTVPPTVTIDAWRDKMDIARRTACGNYAFFIGYNGQNLDEIHRLLDESAEVPGVKVFMGQSTGKMAVGRRDMETVMAEVTAPVVVHAEDDAIIARNLGHLQAEYGSDLPVCLHSRLRDTEACVRATEQAMELAQRYGTRLHLAHISTAAECSLFDSGSPSGKRITAEVSPHHLWWTQDDYVHRGARIKMNPSVKSADDRRALRYGLLTGRLDMVATDHAPHLLSQKQGSLLQAVSGAPVVQFSLPALLTIYDDPVFVARRMSTAPAEVFGIQRRGSIAPGYYADLVLVSRRTWTVHDSDVLSLCGWTPMDGEQLDWQVEQVWVNGCRPGVSSGHPLQFR